MPLWELASGLEHLSIGNLGKEEDFDKLQYWAGTYHSHEIVTEEQLTALEAPSASSTGNVEVILAIVRSSQVWRLPASKSQAQRA